MKDKDTFVLTEMYQYFSLVNKPLEQCKITTYCRSFEMQDISRQGLVELTYSGENWWCPCVPIARLLCDTHYVLHMIEVLVIKTISYTVVKWCTCTMQCFTIINGYLCRTREGKREHCTRNRLQKGKTRIRATCTTFFKSWNSWFESQLRTNKPKNWS